MSYYLESAEKSGTHAIHAENEVAKRDNQYPYAMIVPVTGSYVYQLLGDSADTTTTLNAGQVYAMRPKLVKSTTSGATTVTVLYRS